MIRRFADFSLKRVAPLSVVAIACLAGNSWWTFVNISNLVAASNWVERTADIQLQLAKVETDVVNAETGERGYVLTGMSSYLEPYYSGIRYTSQRLAELDELMSYDPDLLSQMAELQTAVDASFAEMEGILQLMNTRGQVSAGQRINGGTGKALMDSLRNTIAEIQNSVDADLMAQKIEVERARAAAFLALFVFVAGTLLLVALLYVTSRREVARRSQDAAEIKKSAHSLELSIAELRRERNEIQELNEAAGYMQSCDSVPELTRLMSPILGRMFADFSGDVYLHAPSRNRLDGVVSFGGSSAPASIAPSECWALRRGQDHLRQADNGAPECAHHHHVGANAKTTLCVPLIAHGDTLGLLSLEAKDGSMAGLGDEEALGRLQRTERLAQMVGAQLGLTLANLKLQDSLRQQAITDPLTQAFNRRYLDATGDKILAHASRFGQQLAVVMLDVDHFKQYNDLHGHVAGDHALTAVAQFMQAHIREADWLFRYGGEEFLMILHGNDEESAGVKLDAMRAAIAAMQFTHGDTVLPSITVSLGYAIFPKQAATLSSLIRLADEALYQAKATGRNRICMSEVFVADLERGPATSTLSLVAADA